MFRYRTETKPFESGPKFVPSKRLFLFGPGEQVLDQTEIICFQDKFENDTKRFWFRSKTDVGTFVLSFFTLLLCTNAVHVNDKRVHTKSVSETHVILGKRETNSGQKDFEKIL
jgi:hypothetical protein